MKTIMMSEIPNLKQEIMSLGFRDVIFVDEPLSTIDGYGEVEIQSFLLNVSMEAAQDLNAIHGINGEYLLAQILLTGIQDHLEGTKAEDIVFFGYQVCDGGMYIDDNTLTPIKKIIVRCKLMQENQNDN